MQNKSNEMRAMALVVEERLEEAVRYIHMGGSLEDHVTLPLGGMASLSRRVAKAVSGAYSIGGLSILDP